MTRYLATALAAVLLSALAAAFLSAGASAPPPVGTSGAEPDAGSFGPSLDMRCELSFEFA